MYSREKRLKAVELYIKYDKSAADVIRELGYPNRHTLCSWYEKYLEELETGVIHDRSTCIILSPYATRSFSRLAVSVLTVIVRQIRDMI